MERLVVCHDAIAQDGDVVIAALGVARRRFYTAMSGGADENHARYTARAQDEVELGLIETARAPLVHDDLPRAWPELRHDFPARRAFDGRHALRRVTAFFHHPSQGRPGFVSMI